jgi:predicted ATPase
MIPSFQMALKVASCFGMKIDMSIVTSLSQTSHYSSLLEDLNKAVEEGFMDLDTKGFCFRFAHDKFREATYDMIGNRGKFHFEIGMLLLSSTDSRQKGSKLLILSQINHGVPSLLRDDYQRLSIATLNHEAASESMQCYNYTSSYELSKTAISLLPNDSWSTHHDMSIKFYFLLAKAAYAYKKIDEAKVRRSCTLDRHF